MNSTRLVVIGFMVAVVVAIYAFVSQQQAVDQAQLAAFEATAADHDRITAVAMAQEAAGTQVQAEIGQATARAEAAMASTAQSAAQATAARAESQAQQAATRSAQIIASSTAGSESFQSTATSEADLLASVQAQSTSAMGTAQADFDAQATLQADTANQLATATSQVDLADFARQAAESDRARALEQLWDLATQQAETRNSLATAQVAVSSATPTPVPTDVPAPSPTVPPEPTEVSSTDTVPSLTNTFETNSGKVSLQYPRGWFAREVDTDFVSIVNDSALFDRGGNALRAGQYEIDVLIATRNDLGVDSAAATDEVLQNFVDFFKSRDTAFEVGPSSTVVSGKYQGSRVIGTDGSNELTITLLDLGNDGLMLIFGYNAAGESESFIPVMDAVLMTVEYR
ncbi:MAG: hypothetical protein R3E39_12640 [Anaerolineae bacterium]